jgi:hypothetical protein
MAGKTTGRLQMDVARLLQSFSSSVLSLLFAKSF